MSNFFDEMQSEELKDIMNYLEYLETNGLTLDENGNEVPKDRNNEKKLKYGTYYGEDDE